MQHSNMTNKFVLITLKRTESRGHLNELLFGRRSCEAVMLGFVDSLLELKNIFYRREESNGDPYFSYKNSHTGADF